MNRGTYRLHSVPYVIGLIQHLIDDFRIQELYFDDAILTIGRATAIARAMLGHGIRLPWSCWIHWNIGPEGLSLLRRSGCYAVKFGVESADVGVLRQADKASIHLETIRRLIRNCQQNGIRTHGSFMLGLPGETEASLRQTLNLAFSLDLDACQFTIATPLPGTRFYAMAREHGWLVTQDWSQFDALNRCVVEYPECSREQILAAMEEARRRKVRQFLKNPGKAMIYIWKLYRVEGFSRFIRNLAGKVHFALQALVHRT